MTFRDKQVDKCLKAVAPTVPNVPDEGALLEDLAVLLKKAVAQPVVERLACESRLAEKASELAR